MKKSRAIDLSLVCAVAAAAMAAGCGSPKPATSATATGSWEACVDNNQTVVDRQKCDEETRTPHAAGYVPFYRYYYYPSTGMSPVLGSRLTGGSFTRPTGGVSGGGANGAVSSPNVVRGGFGASAGESAGS